MIIFQRGIKARTDSGFDFVFAFVLTFNANAATGKKENT